MKLDRNINEDGRGKYALIKLRTAGIKTYTQTDGWLAVKADAVDFGNGDSDFFVIRLKDKYAAPALAAYALAAYPDDEEYALEVLNLAKSAAEHPNKRQPD